MKNITLVFVFLAFANFAMGQELGNDFRKFIVVTGSAEVSVPPDEIELQIVLKEYSKSDKIKDKVNLKSIETKFFDILNKNGLSRDDLVFDNRSFYWYYWWVYRNDIYKQKIYKIILNNSTDFLSLVQDLDIDGVNSLSVTNSTNKELQKLRKEVKITALRAAKEKAEYLLESIDERIGNVISIEEMPENQNIFWRGNQSILSNVSISSNSTNKEMENLSSIKLRYEVKAKFEIQ